MNRIQHGFSLIDGLIVVAIITMLATLAVPLYRNYQDRAADAASGPLPSGPQASAAPTKTFQSHDQAPSSGKPSNI